MAFPLIPFEQAAKVKGACCGSGHFRNAELYTVNCLARKLGDPAQEVARSPARRTASLGAAPVQIVCDVDTAIGEAANAGACLFLHGSAPS